MIPRRSVPLALLALLAAPSAVAQQSPPDYRTMIVKERKQSVQATLGTYCHPNAEGSGECANAEYPLKNTGKIRVSRNGRLTLLLRAPVSRIAWRAARIDGRGQEQITAVGRGKAITKTQRRWRVTLPKDLSRSTDVLGFDVIYPHAYSSFEVGVTVRR